MSQKTGRKESIKQKGSQIKYMTDYNDAMDSIKRIQVHVLQPIVLGRNWLDHGMLHREVKKMDCIQLFLLLSNWLKVKEAFGKATRSC